MVIEEHAKLELFFPGAQDPIIIQENDIIQNSLSVTSQCVNGNTFGFGCVSPAQLSVKFRIPEYENLNRYDIYGAKIRLYSCFGDHQPESENLRGVFNVTTASKKNGIFTVSALDNICLLDSTAFLGNESVMANTVYETLKGGAQNAVDVFSIMGDIVKKYAGENINFYTIPLWYSNIPNGSADFTDYDCNSLGKNIRKIMVLSDEQSDNIRDYFSWIAEYMGGFIHAGNDGDIQFHLFETPYYHPEPQKLNYSEFEQNSLEIAGFQIYFYSAKVTLEDRQWNSCGTGKKEENGGIVNLESVIQNNPFIEFIYKRGLSLYPIVEALHYYQRNIQIRPFSGTYHGNEYLHLGQYIEITDKDGTSYGTTITNMTWKFRGGQQIRCVGEDSRTLSQARKRSQAIRMGERLKTQINRLRNELKN